MLADDRPAAKGIRLAAFALERGDLPDRLDIDRRDCMALAWMNSAGVKQMFG